MSRHLAFAFAALLAGPLFAQAPAPNVKEDRTLATPSELVAASVSQNGKSLFGLDKDGIARRWALPGGQLDRTFPSIGRSYLMLTSDDGRWVLLAGWEGDFVAWDTSDGREVFRAHAGHYAAGGFVSVSVNPSAYSHSSKFLALAPAGEPVQILDWPSGKKVATLGAPIGGSSCVAFSPDDSRIATADNDGVVRIYETSSGKLLSHFDDFLLEAFAVVFTPDGKQVIAGGADKTVVVIDSSTGRLVRTLQHFPEPIGYLSVSPDGKRVAVALGKAEGLTLPAELSVWNLASGKKEFDFLPPALAIGAAWLADGHWRFITSKAEAVTVWRAD